MPSSHYPPTCTPRPSRLSNAELYALVGPAAPQAATGTPQGRWLTVFTIQAEGLVLQRSTNMAGYKHVGRDMNKPRPFQVKMWRNGKQARFLAPIEESPEACTRCVGYGPQLVASPYRVAQQQRTWSGYRPRMSCIL